ncbi:MAG: hypothetical protein AAF702_04800 [Chloroflexota bacterium]
MNKLPIVGMSFGPFLMVIGSLNPQGWGVGIAFIGSILLSLALVAFYHQVTHRNE